MDQLQELIQQLDLPLRTSSTAAKLLGAALIFFIGLWLSKVLARFIGRLMARRRVDSMLVSFMVTILYVFLLLFTALITISYLGLPVSPLVAILGGAALAVGLAVQGTLANVAAGFSLVVHKPFSKGHYVDAAGKSGTIDRVGLFNTRMITTENCLVVVPNSLVTDGPITNYSAHPTRRAELNIHLDLEDNLASARQVIQQLLNEHPDVLEEPAPAILAMELTDYSARLSVRAWLKASEFWVVRSELIIQIKAALEAAGYRIAVPVRKLREHNTPAGD